jgi:hypothetical protein
VPVGSALALVGAPGSRAGQPRRSAGIAFREGGWPGERLPTTAWALAPIGPRRNPVPAPGVNVSRRFITILFQNLEAHMRWTLSAAAALITFATPIQAQQSEEMAVREAVNQYLKAHATGSSEPIRGVFRPELNMFFVRDGKLVSRTAEEYMSGFRGQPQPDEAQRKRRIASVDVTGSAAVAKVILDYPQATLTDYFALLKIDGKWQIVNKIFHSQPRS